MGAQEGFSPLKLKGEMGQTISGAASVCLLQLEAPAGLNPDFTRHGSLINLRSSKPAGWAGEGVTERAAQEDCLDGSVTSREDHHHQENGQRHPLRWTAVPGVVVNVTLREQADILLDAQRCSRRS